MEASNMKNMVVLKNLPSNIVDEAIIILKNGKKVKKLEKIDNSKNKSRKEKNTKEKDYILKDAEMLVNGYVSKIEKIKKIFNYHHFNMYIGNNIIIGFIKCQKKFFFWHF